VAGIERDQYPDYDNCKNKAVEALTSRVPLMAEYPFEDGHGFVLPVFRAFRLGLAAFLPLGFPNFI
jgi:hypothetical protein